MERLSIAAVTTVASVLFCGWTMPTASAAECPKVVGFDWAIPHKIDPANADTQVR